MCPLNPGYFISPFNTWPWAFPGRVPFLRGGPCPRCGDGVCPVSLESNLDSRFVSVLCVPGKIISLFGSWVLILKWAQ